ncbi:MAG TPA: hypothetical protein VJO34_01590 [Methylomirabilota bacterium]|nr:hypothetical protein [Methylomirabilota bacterium]
MMGQFKWVSIAIVMLLLAIVAPAWADESELDAAAHSQEMTERQDEYGVGYRVGSVLLTSANIPLRGLLCIGSTIVAGGLYIVTLGTSVNATVYMVQEACSGPWIITPEMMKGKPRRSD